MPGRAGRRHCAIPSRIGRFVVLEPIGSGAMGAVYAAFDQQLDRKVAIKLLHPEQVEARHRLMREGQAMAKLAHPNVVHVYEVGTHDRQVFLAMGQVAAEHREGPGWAYVEARLSAREDGTSDAALVQRAVAAIDAAKPSPGIDAELLAAARRWLVTTPR